MRFIKNNKMYNFGCILCCVLILSSLSVSIYIFIFEYDTHGGIALVFLIFDFFGILILTSYILSYCNHNRNDDEIDIDIQQEEYLNLNGFHRQGIQIYNPTFERYNLLSLKDDEVISQKSLEIENYISQENVILEEEIQPNDDIIINFENKT